jgi:hypothetical protein
MKRSIYSHEVFLTGRIVVTVRNVLDGNPMSNKSVSFKACAFT